MVTYTCSYGQRELKKTRCLDPKLSKTMDRENWRKGMTRNCLSEMQ